MSRLTGEKNVLLPFDEVREQLPIRGQHYLGLQEVPIDKIVGSFGRYHDFDRAFLPTQSRTKERWVRIDRAHYDQIVLPPVDLIKMGEIYFVKDGNHRISVARERGQIFVDAHVTEIEIPVNLTADMQPDDLTIKKEQARFMTISELSEGHSEANIELSMPELYRELLEHIAVHRWYLGEEKGQDVSMREASASWYENVYRPLVKIIQEQKILDDFPGSTEADLYVWIIEYQGYLREAYKNRATGNQTGEEGVKVGVARRFSMNYPNPAVRKLIGVLNRATWLDNLLLEQEKALFFDATHMDQLRPDANIKVTVPGQYDRLLEHIGVHRYYLGEQRGAEVSYEEAVASWYDNVYSPLVGIIQDQEILNEFPGRTETDLYIWIIEHQSRLKEAYGSEVPIEQAAEKFIRDRNESLAQKIVKSIKKVTGQK